MGKVSGHAAHVDRYGNVDTGRYDINVRNNFRGTFAEVRDERTGRVVDRIFAGQSKQLLNGKTVSFDANRCGQEITVEDEYGHIDEFSRSSRSGDDWDRDHIRSGRSHGHDRHDCNDRDDHIRGGRSHGHDRTDCNDRDDRIQGGRPSRPGRDDCKCNDEDSAFKVDERNNTVDTGRYVISASGKDDGELKVYDKYTGQWLRAWGDPHFETGDGDKGNFNDTVTLNLDDGTKLTIETTGGPNAHLARAVITKGDHAAEIRFDKDHKPDTDELRGREARNADRDTPDGLRLYTVHGNLDDLRAGRRGEELVGHIDFDGLAHDQQRKYAEYNRYRR